MVADPGYTLRRATLADVPALQELIAVSAREIGRTDYTAAQIEGALRGAFGVDTQLLRDGTYFVIEAEGRLAGCGGWSRRRTLFGGDARADRDAAELDPAADAAKIRAFFIHPQFVRRGFGSAILERCERDAMAHGFSRFELMGTLPGVRLYASRGYAGGERVHWPVGEGLTIEFVPMSKTVAKDPLVIGRAVGADAAAILELQKLAYQSEARLYGDWKLPPLVQTLDSLRADIEETVVLKATIDGALAGSVRARVIDDVCQIGRLIVRPPLQGRGIGTRLMSAIELEMPREFAQTRRFELFTGDRSEGNMRLYERLGYRRCREQSLSPGVTLVFMEKRR
jgi:GNAT superfamily N-acetyltransferase